MRLVQCDCEGSGCVHEEVTLIGVFVPLAVVGEGCLPVRVEIGESVLVFGSSSESSRGGSVGEAKAGGCWKSGDAMVWLRAKACPWPRCQHH